LRIEYGLSEPKIISERCQLVKLRHINRCGPIFETETQCTGICHWQVFLVISHLTYVTVSSLPWKIQNTNSQIFLYAPSCFAKR